MGDIASALSGRAEEVAIVAGLKSGSEEAYEWLIARFHQPIYSLVYRIVHDPADAADTTQEVFLKVFRGIHSFQGNASLKTWMYRIAIREASNQRRWWYRHKGRETSIEPGAETGESGFCACLRETLVDDADSPLDTAMQGEVRERLEQELRQLPEPYRTTVILRDIEELSYEEIAEVLGVSLGTVKSRLMRGRDALRKRLLRYAGETAPETKRRSVRAEEDAGTSAGEAIEVTP
ncbi:MAG TPA: sigma-70 family RNA polymerase sigma factor [Terriglobales bacterium]|nr:sigma-70 family RNA polymerase sigma factor [Terriglobales bacterium]